MRKIKWVRKLFVKLDMLDAEMNFKLYPALLVILCFMLAMLFVLACII